MVNTFYRIGPHYLILASSSSKVKLWNFTFSGTYKHFSLGRSWKAGLYPSAVMVSSLLPRRSLDKKSFRKWIYERSYIVLKIEKNYTFIPTSLFRDCSLIRGFMKDHIYEDMIDHHSYVHNLSTCNIKAWKKFKPERDSNPWPLRYRCNALPTELSSQLEAGHP